MNIGYYDIAHSNYSKILKMATLNVPSFLIDGEDYKIYATITDSAELYGYEISDWSDNVFTLKTDESSRASFLLRVQAFLYLLTPVVLLAHLLQNLQA